MEEDYEVVNARTWDDSQPPPPPPHDRPEDDKSEWQEARNKKKKKQQQQKKKEQKQPQRSVQQRVAPRPIIAPQPPPPDRPAQMREDRPPRTGFRVTGEPSTKKWQTASSQLNRSRYTRGPVPPKQSRPRLVQDTNNAAQLLWRQHKRPANTIGIPPILALENATHRALKALAGSMGAFIHCDEDLDPHASMLTFGIWGEDANVAAAKDALLYRIEEIRSKKSVTTSSFAKISSLTPALRERHEIRWQREIRKNRFRQYPPQHMAFNAIGKFHWPSKEYKPEDVLGSSFEALDAIRMAHSCYIVYVPDLSTFQVMGTAAKVRKALLCLRTTCFQLAAWAINPARLYLVRWSADVDVLTHVCLKAYQGPAIIGSEAETNAMSSVSPRAKGAEIDSQQAELNRRLSRMGIDRLRMTLGNALHKLHFYQGHIKLRIRLGVFLLSSYWKPDKASNGDLESGHYELQDYLDMTKESQFSGAVTEELGDIVQEADSHDLILQANHLLAPHGAMMTSLHEVKPVYTAIFVFDGPFGALRLCLSWNEAEGSKEDASQFVLQQSKWTRLDRDTARPTALLDMSLTDLHTSSAWQFELTATRPVEEYNLPQQLRDFAARVTIDPIEARKQSRNKLFVRYNPFVTPTSLREEVAYRYNIVSSDYTLELRRFQDRTFSAGESVVAKPNVAVSEPRVGLSVFRTEWDAIFSENERLEIGAATQWDDSFEHWFPKDFGWNAQDGDDGFKQLLDKLDKIGKLVKPSFAKQDMAIES